MQSSYLDDICVTVALLFSINGRLGVVAFVAAAQYLLCRMQNGTLLHVFTVPVRYTVTVL